MERPKPHNGSAPVKRKGKIQPGLITDSNMDAILFLSQEANMNASGSTARSSRRRDKAKSPSPSSSSPSSAENAAFQRSKWWFNVLILLLGSAASITCIALGLSRIETESREAFEREANQFVYSVESAWRDYELFGLWLHESCFHGSPGAFDRSKRNVTLMRNDVPGYLDICSRQQFHRLYKHIASVGLGFKAAQLALNISHEERSPLEEESRRYYQENYPNFTYLGITDIDFSNGTAAKVPRGEHDFYYPIHYAEPVQNNSFGLDLDGYAFHEHKEIIDEAARTWKPLLSPRLQTFGEEDPNAYTIMLTHPGMPVDGQERPVAMSRILIRMPSFLARASVGSMNKEKSVYIFDSTESSVEPAYIGSLHTCEDGGIQEEALSPEEIKFSEIPKFNSSQYFHSKLPIAGRVWTICVLSDAYQPDYTWVVVGGTLIFAAVSMLACWFHHHLARVAKINAIKAEAEAVKARSARQQAQKERELNEFMAHEVRNPLSSAISALSFIRSAVQKHPSTDQLPTEEAQGSGSDEKDEEEGLLFPREQVLSDIDVADSSLQFINELLRNMLDVHRAANKQMKLELGPTDIAHDVLEPVASILFMRGAKVDIQLDCPEGLSVNSDRMRLKQIILNLAANATKFVQQGYIKLKAAVVKGSVELSVEDSGPGIPPSKRNQLFLKFQESLDRLNQGTGIGLSVCKSLSELLGAKIWLDEKFDSGVPGCPGSRFVIRLNQPPLEMESSNEITIPNSGVLVEPSSERSKQEPLTNSTKKEEPQLPTSLSVLFVDDDTVLRKMFTRALRRVAPTWDIQEASNGETALRMVDSHQFDVIFMDQYMASVEKQLLGTETVRELRAKGVSLSIICGLSANDVKQQFLDAGANAFLSKPFPCQKEALTTEMLRILSQGQEQRKQ